MSSRSPHIVSQGSKGFSVNPKAQSLFLNCLSLKMKWLRRFKTSETTHKSTQRKTPKEFNLQQEGCKNTKSLNDVQTDETNRVHFNKTIRIYLLKDYVGLIFFQWRNTPSGPGPPHYRGFTITLKTHHSRLDSSGRVISPSQRPIPDNTQQSQETDIHAPGGNRTLNPSKGVAADPRLRQRGHWDRHVGLRPYSKPKL